MTRHHLTAASAACLATFLSPALLAQGFTSASPGAPAARLFTLDTGHTIGGMDVDGSGNVFYLDVPSAGTGTTKLFVRTAASGYAAPVFPIFDYGSQQFGSFVRLHEGTAYFGESSSFSIRSFEIGTGTVRFVGTVVGNYDLAFRGSSEAFVSANASPDFSNPQNKVSKLNLATGQLDTVVRTTDSSGPIAFRADGTLLYGATIFGTEPGGIYQFSAAQIDGVTNPTGPDTSLTLSTGVRRFADGSSNQYFSLEGDTQLFQGDSSGTAAVVRRYDLVTAGAAEIGRTAPGDFLSGVSAANGALFVGVSNFGTDKGAVFRVPVPEPGTGLLALLGLSAFTLRRRRRCI